MVKENSLGNRIIALLLSAVMVLGMFPVGYASAEATGDYATVTPLTGGEVTNNGTANVEVLVEETTLQWVAGNALRAEGWWVGIDVVAPDGYAANATYKVKSNPTAEYGEAKAFADYKDGEKDIQLWFPVSPESLNKFAAENRNLTMTYTFDWNGDDAYEQTIAFSVKPSSKIVLLKDGMNVYPLSTVTTLTGGTVTGNGTANVNVVVDETTLYWVEANALRAEGWWVGIDVVAPANYAANATYKVKSNPTAEYGEAKAFADYKDGENDIQLWFPVSPESLKKFASEGRNLTMTYTFDWNGDGSYEQTIAFSVDPTGAIILKKNGTQVYPMAGTVSTYTGGTITNNGTANVDVLVEETTLHWVAGNELRAEGWWVGIDVVAPAGYAANATYKVKSNPTAEYGEAKAFADYKDGENDIQLWFPVSPESLKKFASEGRNLTMTYTFDWDGDGSYEQTIAFSVKPSRKVVLMKDNVQCYPGLGNVSTYTGGTVTGNQTSDVLVLVDNVTLDWSPADMSIGRAQGWWVGIKVEAPAGVDAETLQNAKYQSKGNPNTSWSEITEVKSFWSNKDSADTEESQYIQLWFPISPASVEKFKNENRNITMVYRFDWDGQGTYEQEITFSVDPTGNIQLNKVDQSGFKFVDETPADIWVGDVYYQNVVTGGQGDGEVTFAIISGDAATINTTTGELTFTKAGTVTVQATKAADSEGYYNAAIAQYTITAAREDQYPKFETTNPGVIAYAPGLIYENALVEVLGGTVTYAIVNEDVNGTGVATIDAATGKLTIIKAGTITVQATISGDVNYNPATASYTVVVDKAEQTGFAFANAPTELTWQGTALDALQLVNGKGEGVLYWNVIAGNEVASVDEAGNITLHKAGSFTIQAQKAGDDCYKDSAVITASILVNLAPQTGFDFAQKTVTVTYNDNGNKYSQVVTGGLSQADAVYTVIAGDAASVNAETGEVTILKSGVVTIQAVQAADEQYDRAVKTYELIIEKADQSFTFGHEKEIDELYGLTSFETLITVCEKNSKVITYTESDNNIGASVDDNGVVTFVDSNGKVGSVTVTVTMEGDDCYNPFSDSYVINLDYLATDALPIPNGTKINNSGWWTGSLILEAPEGFTIAYENKLSTEFASNVQVNKDGIQSKTVYLKNAEGFITDGIVVNDLRLDTVNPTDLKITYTEPVWEKVLNEITFGIYKNDTATLSVTVAATDETSGIAKLVYNYGEGDVEKTFNGDRTASYTFDISAQYKDNISLVATDVAGRTSAYIDERVLVLDTLTPELSADYAFEYGQYREENGIYYTHNNVDITFSITEHNFTLAEKPVVTINGVPADVEWNITEDADIWKTMVPLRDDGDYVVEVSFADAATNQMTTYTKEIHIDRVVPTIEITLDDYTAIYENCYKQNRTATVKITAHNFAPYDVNLAVLAKNILGEEVDISAKEYTAFAADPANWKYKDANGNYVSDAADAVNADEHYLILPVFDIDASYEISVNYTDLAGNAAETATDAFIIDHEDAQNIQITYSTSLLEQVIESLTFGFYQADVTVTVTAEDITSGVDYFMLSYNREATASDAHTGDFTEKLEAQAGADAKTFTASFTVPAQARGSFSVQVFDKAGNDSEKIDNTVKVTDTIAPEVQITYAPEDPKMQLTYVDSERNDVIDFATADSALCQGDVKATITVKEANFFELSGMHQMIVKVTKTDDDNVTTVTEYLPADLDWEKNVDTYTASIVFADNGDYVLSVEYTDFSNNAAQIAGTDGISGEGSYTSKVITVDEDDPKIEIAYNVVEDDKFYNTNRTATITVTEHNFKADEFVLNVIAQDIFGNDVEVADYATTAKNLGNWTENGNVYTLELPFEVDANYQLTADYTDVAGRTAKTVTDEFTIDHEDAQNIQITYSTSLLEQVIESLTFGFYQADVTVTVTAEDITSGVDYFMLSYSREATASDAHTGDFTEKLEAQAGADDKTFTASFTVPAQARGSFSVQVFDKAGNDSEKIDNTVKVTDTIDPEIQITYTPVNAQKPMYFMDGNYDYVETFNAATNAFCGGDVKATITVKEANFFELSGMHQVIVKVTKTDDNDVTTVTEYMPADLAWEKNVDTYTASIVFAEDGDYVLSVEYTDFSKNAAQIAGTDGISGEGSYTSKIITVDETAPVVTIVHKNKDATEDQVMTEIAAGDNYPVRNDVERQYFGKDRVTVITVEEHNFQAKYIDDTIIVEDLLGANVATENVVDYLTKQTSWKQSGNVYTAEIYYTVDANYSFDMDYQDLAKNPAVFEGEENTADYKTRLFTVDKEAPALKDKVGIFFDGYVNEPSASDPLYYDKQAVITLKATDMISGVKYFKYMYKLNPGVSGVNAGMTEFAVLEAKYDSTEKYFYASFTVPAEALTEKNQFNGTIDFSVHDRSENTTETIPGNTTLIVDSITPKVTISYNAPVRDADGISYYDGNIDVTIAVNEANFDSTDVVVKVTRNGAAYTVKPKWTNDSNNPTDKHFGTFTLTQDGDYEVYVAYTDKSGNAMEFTSKTGKGSAEYKSNQLTLDTVKPVITVSNIKADSANKEETYSFVITADDINLNDETFKPELKAVVKDESGKYVTVDIELGEMQTITSGKTYSFTVDNLPQDGLYTLTCYVEDMSANSMSQVILDDGKSYEKVQFSINREGSVFVYGSEYTESLVNKYYIYSVDEDVVIEEINVDPIENYTVTLNGKELTEGTDYTTQQTSGNGQWSKRTYTINKSLFAAEGEYAIIVSSTDKAQTTAFSDIKNLTLSFVVDQTKPVLNITGLATNGRYQTELQTVTLIPTDEGGRLNSLTVIVMDSDGNPLKDKNTGADISVRFQMEGEALLKELEDKDGVITFTIPQGLNNKVQIICNDCAVNAQDLTNEYNELFEKVTVSPNGLVIFYADTPLFVGTIAGVIALGALIIFLIKRKGVKKAAK